MSATPKGDDLRKLISRLDPDSIRFFQGAMTVCQSRAHFEITPEHMLLRLADDTTGDVAKIFDTFKVDRAQVRRAIQRVLEDVPSGHRGKPVLSEKLVELFQSAAVMSEEFGFHQIRPGMLIMAIALNPSHTAIGEITPELDRIDVDQLRDHFHEIVMGAAPAGAPGEAAGGGSAMPAEGGALAQFTIDVTANAEAGKIDPVFGRDHEIRQMIDIFGRRRKNNPILVGEPGTGKTAIVEGLALRIVEGDVPPILKGVKLITLDLGLLQAGASVKGEFENRLKNVITEIKASEQPIITFIDEAHTLIGAGGAAGGGDAANLLKPALARGELRTCAATTWAEYKKYFEKDAALARRFQLVRCDEPAVDDAIVMLRGLKDKYEKHHKVFVLDEAVEAAARLSARYISGRFLPDKAVDLLDTSAARVAVGLSTRPGKLDDYDRQLNNVTTAIAAMERDKIGGVHIDDEALKELAERRDELAAQREAFEETWKAELEAVNEIRDMRAKLPGYASIVGDEQPADGESDESAEKAEPVNEDEIRASLDAAIAKLNETRGESPLVHAHVDEACVASVVADWTGIPIGSMVKNEIQATLEMEDHLRNRVVGQDHALNTIAEKLRTSRAGLGNPDQPKGSFLLVGPSGTGKTELALAIAELLFGGDEFITTINMSEFMEKHTVSLLKGSPPGYVGYGEGGILTEAVRQHPYSVVLLDEVEKAHPDVMNLFYQVFDKGSLADGEGRVINFRNTVIIMTSNIGTDVIQGMCESGEEIDVDELKEAIYPHLREHFKPALVARMTVVPYFTLSEDVLKDIARIKVRKVANRIQEAHQIRMDVDEDVYATMASMCNQVDIGARQIDHLLDRAVLPELSRQLLAKMTEEDMPSVVKMANGDGGEFVYTFEA